MRFTIAATLLGASFSSLGAAFVPSLQQHNQRWGVVASTTTPPAFATNLFSTAEKVEVTSSDTSTAEAGVDGDDHSGKVNGAVSSTQLSGSEIKSRLDAQLEKLREKDSQSKKLSKEDIKVVFEDDHIIVVDKPAGVLTISGKEGYPSLAQAVCDSFGCELGEANKMVVHRLGMDTSGLVVLAKTAEAVRGMNAVFRTRNIERKYEALVCGHMDKDEGMIDLPLMRDYEHPPFMRVSTDDHQAILADLTVEDIGKKLLERPKDSLTKYQVVAREDFEGQPVTRVALTSISGRTHQLNVHLAAFGHPIVGDTTYGINGAAAPNGGLNSNEMDSLAPNNSRASEDVQKSIASAAKTACVHAKSLKFRHPITKKEVSLSSDAPF